MDVNPENHPWLWPESPVLHPLDDLEACVLCRRNISPENEATWDLNVFSICGDCKFLFLEDLGSPLDSHRSWRTTSYDHSETADSIFSQNVTHMMNFLTQDQPNAPFLGDQSFEHDSAATLPQHNSSRTTPRGSRRWPRAVSDSETLELDSVYGGSESNFSIGGSRNHHVGSDAVSFSAYGAGSDISVDGRSFLDTDLFRQLGNGSDFDSDTDIDPMHTGLNQWDSDDDDEWETDIDANPIENTDEPQDPNFFVSRLGNTIDNLSQHRTPEAVVSLRTREGRQSNIANILANLEESDMPPHVGNLGDYMDARGFEEFLDYLADGESSRQGAPPAALSFLSNMPRIVITKEHCEKRDDLTCAICKDSLFISAEVNQLPCSHIYHPFCILPWLRVRNSCPLCRYELPTDDLEYEDKKRANNNGLDVQQLHVNDDITSNITDDAELSPNISTFPLQGESPEACHVINESGRENRRGGWLYLAAPIVSIVGLALVFWFGNPMSSRRAHNLQEQNQHLILHSVTPPNIQRQNQRRWWSLF
uniref:RING-type E3 ubiquitin transferase n=1 Tax=Kalanchoe fedtschenkoi TaxID=63787 RepID=A0A7N0UYR0_KALFE